MSASNNDQDQTRDCVWCKKKCSGSIWSLDRSHFKWCNASRKTTSTLSVCSKECFRAIAVYDVLKSHHDCNFPSETQAECIGLPKQTQCFGCSAKCSSLGISASDKIGVKAFCDYDCFNSFAQHRVDDAFAKGTLGDNWATCVRNHHCPIQ